MSATITHLEAHLFRAPIATPVANAFGAMTNRPALFLRMAASDGAYGWGEVFCNFPQVGAEHRKRLVESIFRPLCIGRPAADPDTLRAELVQRTRAMAIQCGEPGPFAQIAGAVDQCLYDLCARRAGEPLWRYLGGNAPVVRVYASGIGPDRVVDIALAKRDAGYRAFKLKVGFGADRDRGNLAALREALGADATIMTDANQAWPATDAAARIAELAPLNPLWIEEPMLADESTAAWARLAEASAVPLAAGENIRGDAAFDAALDAGYLRYVQPDVGKWGGIGGCRDVARRALGRGIVYCPHWLAGGIGLAASMHLLAAVGDNRGYAEVDANPNPLREEVYPMEVSDGCVHLPEAPGLGVEPDLAQLSAWRID